jgi:hypothetical protein
MPSESRRAEYGNKTIHFKVRFWTDDIAPNEGEIILKHMHGAGFVIVPVNAEHGIGFDKVAFNSMAELPLAIEKAIIAANITVHNSRKEAKYRASDEPTISAEEEAAYAEQDAELGRAPAN